jgi:hypothetical protein
MVKLRVPCLRSWITAAALLPGAAGAQPSGAEAQVQSTVSASAQAPASADFKKDILPLMEKYCWDCHGDGADKGEVNFDKYKDAAAVLADRKIWAGVAFHVSQWTMPPAKRSDQPTVHEREVLTKYIDQLLNPVDPNRPDPGRVTIRRLNRVEYNNTVRDILGVDLRPADDFPEDDTGYGFDNIGDVLALPPILMERYLTAADRVLAAALPPGAPPSEVFEVEDEGLTGQGFPDRERGRLMAFNGTCGSEFLAPASGEYRMSAKVWATQAGGEPARLALVSGDHTGSPVDVTATDFKNPQTVEAVVRFEKGSRKIGVTFLNDFWDDAQPDPDKRDRNLYVLSLQVEGPVKADPLPPTPGEERLLAPAAGVGETPEAAEKILTTFAWRCFRRPARPEELERLMRIYKAVRAQDETHRDALRLAMKAVMVSPYFLYRIQNQPDPNNPDAVIEIDEFALASRLSYWLWSSTPDDELLKLAEAGQLRANLTAQVRRLLKDPKSRALPVNFGGQWLELRTLNVVAPDKDRFPQFSAELREDMRRETEELFQCIVQENRSVLDFLAADFTFLNDRLAKYYGIGGVDGGEFRRVSLPPESRRKGVLTHASVLTITSDPTRTSPVKRGKWVLENMLGIIPPPPPPNVPALEEDAHAELTGSVRQRLEAHRSKPGCASCHALMDPIGFGLENFNAIGQWRDKDGNFPVDSSGILTTGQKFNNAGELAQVLLTDRRDTFLHALVNKMLTYALGRGTEPTDRPAVEAIIQRMAKENDSFESLVLGIAESVPFQKRRGDAFLKNHAADTAAPKPLEAK